MPFPKRSKYAYKTKEWQRDRQLVKNYGITLGEWEELFKQQNNCCAICGTDQMRGKNWHTDHDHETGKVRAILCGWCNTALGKFQEDPDLMFSAAIYTLIHRYRNKNGLEDLRKAKHYLDMLIEFEYGKDVPKNG